MGDGHSSIVRCLVEKIDDIIKWGCSVYSIPILIVNTKWTFSNRCTTSHVSGSLLKYDAFFALHDTLETWETGGVFYERLKRVENDPVIGTFTGSGLDLLVALVCHEMAHIFENASLQEDLIPTKVSQYYGITPRKSKSHHHHNKLWCTIYRELKTTFMPSYKKELPGTVEVVKIASPTSVDFYARCLTAENKPCRLIAV